MTITANQLAAIFPRCPDAGAWASAISRSWQRYGFETLYAQAGFLGIVGNETGGLTNVTREGMGYTLARAKEVFKKVREHPDDASDRLARGSKAFGSWIYAGVLGNGDEASGDGWTYRGRGIIQLTGRANYAACASAIGVDLITNPDMLCNEPDVSAAAAAWFMAAHARILPKLGAASEASFLEGARLVGWTDAAATARRIAYRKAALTVLAQAAGGTEPSNVQPMQIAPAPASKDPLRTAPPQPGRLERVVAALLALFGRRS